MVRLSPVAGGRARGLTRIKTSSAAAA